jgi:PhoPQ-activated pathogenicity-related protein
MTVHSLQLAKAKKLLGARVPEAQGAADVYITSLEQMSEAMEAALESATPAYLAAIGEERREAIVSSAQNVINAADALRRRADKFGKFPLLGVRP